MGSGALGESGGSMGSMGLHEGALGMVRCEEVQ